jgi:hypothetical protein
MNLTNKKLTEIEVYQSIRGAFVQGRKKIESGRHLMYCDDTIMRHPFVAKSVLL